MSDIFGDPIEVPATTMRRIRHDYPYAMDWYCWCGAYYGTYEYLSPASDPARMAATAAATRHRATHRKGGANTDD